MLKLAKIIFEDEWILVVDKSAGVVVNRAQTISAKTLQDDLLEYFRSKSDSKTSSKTRSDLVLNQGIRGRAGIVHRLDKETSGLLVVAKVQKAFDDLQSQFKNRKVEKKYIALVHGLIKEDEGNIEQSIVRIASFGKFGIAKRDDIGVREAHTIYKVVDRFEINDKLISGSDLNQGPTLNKNRVRYLKQNAKEYSLLDVFPKTGRTHQIRVHLKAIGHPVVSDLIYGPGKLIKFDLTWCPRLFLHASEISFDHPKTKKSVSFDADLPKDLKDVILNLNKV